ncbi:type II secretion system F family protein [Microbacterium sp. zg.B48]|uniref:type II secretion system F family protein n=1 Tax=Microbacterium sp. zg.B48 TaxID=2969408 RepID=UPI00214CB164|nr:type II secretion system F family protein [Microbacterium sp. zg.B48]MCR2762613.1 type II secretion system F family protein [Microbacterium sp. zg.B48]
MAARVMSASIAETVLRLAVLLQAGIAPARAWTYLAESGDPHAARVGERVATGVPLAAAIATAAATPATAGRRRIVRSAKPAPDDTDPWRDVAAAWEVATAVGAPLAESLRALSAALRDAQEAADEVRVALAEPAATAKLMGWLPLVAVLLGVALGFDTFGTLVSHPIGIACLVLGSALILAAHRWNAALVRRARAGSGIPGLGAELLAIALSGGVSIDRARRLVQAATGDGTDAETDALLDLSRSAGVPAVELLRASSALARHRARVEGRLRAARLSSRLLLPLGVCTLPAFMLLGVAPMLLSVMTAMPMTI